MDAGKKKKEKQINLIKLLPLLLLAILFLLLTLKTTEYIEVGRRSFAAFVILLSGTGTIAFVLGRIKKTEGIADIFALLFSALAIYYAIILISNERFCLYLLVPEFNPFIHLYGFLTVFMVYLGVFAIVGNAKHTAVFVNTAFTIFALGNNICYRFRERPLTYSDLSAWKETINIAGEGYSLDFSEKAYYGIAFVAVATLLIILVLMLAESLREDRKESKKILIGKRAFSKSLLISRILCFVAAASLYTTMYAGDFLKDQNVNRHFFRNSPIRESPFLDFCCSIKNSKLEKPENYAPESISIQQKPGFKAKNQSDGMKPNIIVVLSESYTDMRDVLPIETNINPYSFFDEFKKQTRWGKLYVSAFGGATANVEFELLTGCNTAFFPTGIIPYNWYIQSEFPSLFSTLKAQGYSTLTIHPFMSDFWNREEVYKYFGVEESYWDEDFENPEFLRNYISDKENYRFLIDRFEEKEPDKPIFIFNITMQNHGPYTLDLPSVVKVKLEETYPELEQYLDLIKITGEETEKLIEYFRNVEEPTIIVFFGDHLPAIGERILKECEKLWAKELEVSSRRVEMQTTINAAGYYIWANFDFEPGRGEDISINYLQGEILNFAGLKAPPFISFQHETLRKKWPVIIERGCKKADGTWVELGDPEFLEDEGVQKYYALHYNLISDIKHRRNDIFCLN